ncbi:hypothetical protein E2C01_036435 [Portunus trituberculatus]|uniref:Uncharacterized protein n=1 Tax=Portunus trituberculatus TaxID=210409 RepID=A0A5B7FBC8_PORTR|nr:hypothetical protein [Portunus trituberculatus]
MDSEPTPVKGGMDIDSEMRVTCGVGTVGAEASAMVESLIKALQEEMADQQRRRERRHVERGYSGMDERRGRRQQRAGSEGHTWSLE